MPGQEIFLNLGETIIYTLEQKLNAIDRVNKEKISY
jgi:hypothetical protein